MASLVAPVMGTTVSIDVRDPGVADVEVAAALALLERLEARFSTFREDSEVSRIDRRELQLADADPSVREVLDACKVLHAESGGAFDAWRDGHLDPSGYVKGWAGDRAAERLRAAGATAFALNIGGDVVCAGEPEHGRPWRIGIRDPEDAARLVAVIGIRDGALATSGLYERGGHVTDPRSGIVPTAWRSVSIVAPDLATADALATTALAMGPDGPAWAASRYACHVAAVDAQHRLWMSPGMSTLRLA
ncbi:MAG: FAD:protein FMN transferase [Chloroflexota bacterium]